jgi:predicted RNase H-like HicB family nuclease
MPPDTPVSNGPVAALVQVRPEPPGRFTAQVVGLPDIHATAITPEEAVELVRAILAQWLASGRLSAIAIPAWEASPSGSSAARNDPLEQEFLEDLARYRKEDLERTLREDEQKDEGCSSTSSTPTT